jgi:hypothetical protein
MNAKKGRRSGGVQRQAGQDMSEPINIAMSAPVAPLAVTPGDVQSHIGRQLRSLYDSVVQQPVPDRFLELLSKLDEKSGGKKDQE